MCKKGDPQILMSFHHDIKASDIKSLSAINKNGDLEHIPMVVMRKLKHRKQQKKLLKGRGAICIVCNFVFYDKPIKWSNNVRAICHPFRDTSMFPKDKPKYLLSESDYCDRRWLHSNCRVKRKEWDFIWFSQDQAQGVKCKGLHMLEIVDLAAKELGIRGLLVDYCKRPQVVDKDTAKQWEIDLLKIRKRMGKLSNISITRRTMNCEQLCESTKKSRFMLFPNTKDASPRMIPESIIRGTPVMINNNIYGGWKYVNEKTGTTFDGPMTLDELRSKKDYYVSEMIKSMKYMVSNEFDPKEVSRSYHSEFGFFNASKNMAKIINENFGTSYKLVAYREFKKLLVKFGKKL